MTEMKIIDWARGLFKKQEAPADAGATLGKDIADEWHKSAKRRTGVAHL